MILPFKTICIPGFPIDEHDLKSEFFLFKIKMEPIESEFKNFNFGLFVRLSNSIQNEKYIYSKTI